MTCKTGLLEIMLFLCISICCSYGKLHEEIAKLKEIFTWNSYPEIFIDRCIKNFLNELYVPKAVELTAAKKELILVLPYLGQQSSEIWNRIQCCFKKNTSVFNLKVVFQSRKWLFTLFTFKDKNNKMLHSNLVYKFKCNICNDIYYGKTKHHFKVRACEHLCMMPLTGKKVKSRKEVAVFDQIIHTVHNASFDGFETLARECDEFRLLLRESLLILCDDPFLNRYVKSILLELFSWLSTI